MYTYGYNPSCVSPVFRERILNISSGGLSLFFSRRSVLGRKCLGRAGSTSVAVARNIVKFCSKVSLSSMGKDSCSITRALKLPIVLIVGTENTTVALMTAIGKVIRFHPSDGVHKVLLGEMSTVLCPELGRVLRGRLTEVKRSRVGVINCVPRGRIFRLRDHRLKLMAPRRVRGLRRGMGQTKRVLTGAISLRLLRGVTNRTTM